MTSLLTALTLTFISAAPTSADWTENISEKRAATWSAPGQCVDVGGPMSILPAPENDLENHLVSSHIDRSSTNGEAITHTLTYSPLTTFERRAEEVPQRTNYRWCLTPGDSGCELSGSSHHQINLSTVQAILPHPMVWSSLRQVRNRPDDRMYLGTAPQGVQRLLERPPQA